MLAKLATLTVIFIAVLIAGSAPAQAAKLPRPPHYNGWICIHNQEASWYDDGAPYYGGLQMSWNWMGAVPGGNAGRLLPRKQMWIAEKVSRKYRFSYSFMKQQWPNTYPPCIRHF